MSNYQAFLERLNPKVAKMIKTAQETETVKYKLASRRLTRALNGGIGEGRITLIYGNSSAGKTALALQSIGKLQEQGLVCAFVDTEGTFEKKWAERLGVNNSELILVTTSKSSGRVEKDLAPLLEAEVDVLVIDSISDIMPEAFVDKEGELKDQEDRKQVGAHAKAITALLNGILYRNKRTAVIIISQVTTKFGQSYVEMIPHGGEKTKFASSTMVRVTSSASPGQQIEEEVSEGGYLVKKPVARKVEFIVTKNKLGQPFLSGHWNFYYAGPHVGIDEVQELVQIALEYGIVSKSGAWYEYDGVKLQGEGTLVARLREDVDLHEKLSKEVDETLERIDNESA